MNLCLKFRTLLRLQPVYLELRRVGVDDAVERKRDKNGSVLWRWELHRTHEDQNTVSASSPKRSILDMRFPGYSSKPRTVLLRYALAVDEGVGEP